VIYAKGLSAPFQLSRTGPSCNLGRKVVENLSCQAGWLCALGRKVVEHLGCQAGWAGILSGK
jgi:hypothetical protein